MTATPWWRNAVIYQVYVRSFRDSDGDGIGDFGGLESSVDYLVRLGVDGVWLNPCYPSPQHDHGYDVADYFSIEPDYGSLDKFDEFVRDAHAHGLKVLMDIVPNHCSSEHPWFVEAINSPPGSPARDRFWFRPIEGDEPPNNWQSHFGGSAWSQAGGEWYLHLFDPTQPDLNWRNPEVRQMFLDVLRFWFDRGVDGFRIDVAHGNMKDPALSNWDGYATGDFYNTFALNRDEVHDIYREWRALADSYDRELTFVGEVWVPTVEDLAKYLRPDELHQAFFFDLLKQPWDAAQFRASIQRAIADAAVTKSTITWTLANHDVHRSATRYGIVERTPYPEGVDPSVEQTRPRGVVDEELGVRRARAAAMLVMALPGSMYLYQGEELGLLEVLDLPDDARQDPTFARTGRLDPGRDGCRVPLPWQADGPSFGFSTNEHTWLPQPDWFGRYAAEVEATDSDSTLTMYREALALRPKLFDGTDFAWVETGRDDVVAFRRGATVSVTNFGAESVALDPAWGQPQLASAGSEGVVAANTTVWFG